MSEFGKEFDIDEVYKTESSFIGSLTPVEDFRHVEVPPGTPLNFDEQMLEEVCFLFLYLSLYKSSSNLFKCIVVFFYFVRADDYLKNASR